MGTYLLYDLFLFIRPVLIYPPPNEPNTDTVKRTVLCNLFVLVFSITVQWTVLIMRSYKQKQVV